MCALLITSLRLAQGIRVALAEMESAQYAGVGCAALEVGAP
jgi:hypothetical protein